MYHTRNVRNIQFKHSSRTTVETFQLTNFQLLQSTRYAEIDQHESIKQRLSFDREEKKQKKRKKKNTEGEANLPPPSSRHNPWKVGNDPLDSVCGGSFAMAGKNTATLAEERLHRGDRLIFQQREKRSQFDRYFSPSWKFRFVEQRLFYPANKSNPRIIRSPVGSLSLLSGEQPDIKLRRRCFTPFGRCSFPDGRATDSGDANFAVHNTSSIFARYLRSRLCKGKIERNLIVIRCERSNFFFFGILNSFKI